MDHRNAGLFPRRNSCPCGTGIICWHVRSRICGTGGHLRHADSAVARARLLQNLMRPVVPQQQRCRREAIHLSAVVVGEPGAPSSLVEPMLCDAVAKQHKLRAHHGAARPRRSTDGLRAASRTQLVAVCSSGKQQLDAEDEEGAAHDDHARRRSKGATGLDLLSSHQAPEPGACAIMRSGSLELMRPARRTPDDAQPFRVLFTDRRSSDDSCLIA